MTTNRPGTDAGFWGMALARDSKLARYQGPEQIDSRNVDFSSLATVQLPPFNLRRPIEEILIRISMRAGVTVGAYTQVAAEAPQSILQRVVLRGNHTSFGSQTPIDLSGATAFVYPLLFQRAGGQVFTSVGGGALTLAPNPGVPFTSPFLGTVANHDMIVIYRIPLTPILGADQSVKRQNVNYLYFERDWLQTLQLELTMGSPAALGDPTGATVAFTSFGAATGTPLVETFLNYGILAEYENATIPGIVVRNEQQITTLTAQASASQVVQLQKQITNAVIVKSGVLETSGTVANVQAFESLSDVILDRTQITVDQRPIRQNADNLVERCYYTGMMDISPLQGYLPLSFIESQNPLTAYRGDDPRNASAQFTLLTDVLTTNAAQRINVIQEIVKGGLYPRIG